MLRFAEPARGAAALRLLGSACCAHHPIRTAGQKQYSTSDVHESVDVAIVGGGLNGTAVAAALGNAPAFRGKQILLLDSMPGAPSMPPAHAPFSNRVVAIRPGSADFLHAAGAWETIQKARCWPFEEMNVWDACRQGEIHFSAKQVGRSELGFLVENNVVQAALLSSACKHDNVRTRYGVKVQRLELPSRYGDSTPAKLHTDTHGTIAARLVIAADGAQSFIRKEAGIDTIGWSYDQHGVVATVKVDTRGTPNRTAWQRFLPTGPVALLPISDDECSIVWSTRPSIAKELCSIDSGAFVAALNNALLCTPNDEFPFSATWTAESDSRHHASPMPSHVPPTILNVQDKSRAAFPLAFGHAVHYVSPRVALIGDAAHRIHPLAGQGVNLGWADAQDLCERLVAAAQTGGDLGDAHVLMEYETARQRGNAPMLATTDLLQRLFSTDFAPVALIRAFGLSATNQFGLLKSLLVNHALA